MLKRILPKEYSFFDFFDKHIQVTTRVCQELLDLTSNGQDIAGKVALIHQLEHEADQITHECIEALHKTFITPIERTDILQLIKQLDDILDSIDAACSRIELYGIVEMRQEAREMAEVLVSAVQEIAMALQQIRNLKNIEQINKNCIAVHELENRGDSILRSALIRLFQEDQPILIIKWKEIFERLEKAVDRCENVANIIEGVVISAS
jgi:predicted phosphate transport protein (TIGR00153 family)